ncbi:Uncharacterised protein [Yersinia enterocolitica]|nr:Uncharacterised protein [Yersinia enterocolitica]
MAKRNAFVCVQFRGMHTENLVHMYPSCLMHEAECRNKSND